MSVLENENIRIEALAEHGGKICSIFDKKSGFELLFQNPKSCYRKAECGSPFDQFEACGFDDTFPSIDKESIIFENRKLEYVDHGEIWSSKMDVVESTNSSLTLSLDSSINSFHFEKSFKLLDRGVKCIYKITNTGSHNFPCFYTFHCLVNTTSDAILIMPPKTDEILVVGENTRFSKNPTSYPISYNGIDISKPSSVEDGKCEKFYVNNSVSEGICGYVYPSKKIKVLISYDKEELPYLGFWNTQGGFRGDYNIALEMSNGFYDSVSVALKNNKCPILKPRETMSFSFDINIENIEK